MITIQQTKEQRQMFGAVQGKPRQGGLRIKDHLPYLSTTAPTFLTCFLL